MKKIIFLVLAVLLIAYAASDPPEPKTVRGEVRQVNEVDMAGSGVLVYINNTDSGYNTTTYTYGPPTMPGIFSATVLASELDLIYLRALNDTHWGEVYGTMGPTQLDIVINLNQTRTSEAVVEILVPDSNLVFNSSEDLNVTANITIVGADGILCEAAILFSNPDAFGLRGNEEVVHSLGNLPRGTTVTESWNISSLADGISNITVSASCLSDRKIFLDMNNDTAVNLTSEDVSSPLVSILWPGNNTRRNNPLLVYYEVEDNTYLTNCTLTINDVLSNVTYAPAVGNTLNFSNIISARANEIEINCTDGSEANNMGSSGIFNYTLNNFPYISLIEADDPVNLLAGANKTVYCNGTAADLDSYSDILNINASLYFNTNTPDSEYNRSTKYDNSSCTLLNPSGSSIDFVCGFDLEYYAFNGTWYCNATVIDNINSTNSSETSILVNDLIALSITPVIDFGQLEPLQISPVDAVVNVTNLGNVAFDLSIHSYAQIPGDNKAMVCDEGDIDFEFERFSTAAYQNFLTMTAVNNSQNAVDVDFNLSQKVYGSSLDSIRNLYWKLQIPFAADGMCSGKIVVSAIVDS